MTVPVSEKNEQHRMRRWAAAAAPTELLPVCYHESVAIVAIVAILIGGVRVERASVAGVRMSNAQTLAGKCGWTKHIFMC